jgi:hypothetical protein
MHMPMDQPYGAHGLAREQALLRKMLRRLLKAATSTTHALLTLFQSSKAMHCHAHFKHTAQALHMAAYVT